MIGQDRLRALEAEYAHLTSSHRPTARTWPARLTRPPGDPPIPVHVGAVACQRHELGHLVEHLIRVREILRLAFRLGGAG